MTRAVANTASPSDRGVAAGCDGPDLTVNEEGEVAELSTTPPLIVGTLKVPGLRVLCAGLRASKRCSSSTTTVERKEWKEEKRNRTLVPVFANTI